MFDLENINIHVNVFRIKQAKSSTKLHTLHQISWTHETQTEFYTKSSNEFLWKFVSKQNLR